LYIYRIRAFNGIGASDFSNPAATETLVAPPAAPTNVTATVGSSTSISVHWADNATTETDYRVEMRIGAGAFAEVATVGANVTGYAKTGLTPSTGLHLPGPGPTTPAASPSYAVSPQVHDLPRCPPRGALGPHGPAPRTAPTSRCTGPTASTTETSFKIERKLGAGLVHPDRLRRRQRG